MASKNNSEGSEGQSSDGDCVVNLVCNSVKKFAFIGIYITNERLANYLGA